MRHLKRQGCLFYVLHKAIAIHTPQEVIQYEEKNDCVEMKYRSAEKVCEAIQGMTLDEEVAYWRKRTKEARRWLATGAAPTPFTQDFR